MVGAKFAAPTRRWKTQMVVFSVFADLSFRRALTVKLGLSVYTSQGSAVSPESFAVATPKELVARPRPSLSSTDRFLSHSSPPPPWPPASPSFAAASPPQASRSAPSPSRRTRPWGSAGRSSYTKNAAGTGTGAGAGVAQAKAAAAAAAAGVAVTWKQNVGWNGQVRLQHSSPARRTENAHRYRSGVNVATCPLGKMICDDSKTKCVTSTANGRSVIGWAITPTADPSCNNAGSVVGGGRVMMLPVLLGVDAACSAHA